MHPYFKLIKINENSGFPDGSVVKNQPTPWQWAKRHLIGGVALISVRGKADV